MKTSFLKVAFLLGATLTLFSFEKPKDWFNAGSKPKSYEMGIDKGAGQNGTNAATIKSVDKKIKGFGTLMQQVSASKYLGKRVRMTAYVKSENVSNWAGLWMRVDQSCSSRSLSFDNMRDRPIKKTTSWEKYEIVLDVPENASQIAYGALLHGTGQIWFDNISFEVVDKSVPTTGSKKQDEPSNLDFEQ